ncbi:nuclear transport factor 2 family protein [Rhodococcus sp. ARC_M5]|uniref:nuclear transport factor 2 family protein n=1 Tax=Rhodococcus sp. ARC_M5 TaxID=2928851 RepID=UPI001FB50D07|nr:nuclear transport factor 2 family protein [Rhodococcus sp. ARC_M5]
MRAGIEALRTADQAGDADAMGELLAPDVVCRSPFASTVRFEGRDEVVALHRDVFAILEDRDSGEPLVNESTGSFNFSGRVRGTPVDGMILATFDERGQISELKIFIRPLLALSAMFRALPPRVSRRRGGPVKARLTAMGGWLFALIARPIEKLAPFLIPHSGALPNRDES